MLTGRGPFKIQKKAQVTSHVVGTQAVSPRLVLVQSVVDSKARRTAIVEWKVPFHNDAEEVRRVLHDTSQSSLRPVPVVLWAIHDKGNVTGLQARDVGSHHRKKRLHSKASGVGAGHELGADMVIVLMVAREERLASLVGLGGVEGEISESASAKLKSAAEFVSNKSTCAWQASGNGKNGGSMGVMNNGTLR